MEFFYNFWNVFISIFSSSENLVQRVLENISLLTGIVSIIYIIKQKPVGWIFGFISSAILINIYFSSQVYLQSLLNLYYAFAAIYGYILWIKKGDNNKYVLKIADYSLKSHVIIILFGLIITVLLDLLMTYVFKSNLTLLDSSIFSFSIIATALQTKKIKSNWLYWMAINSLAILLALKAQLYPVALLMSVYLAAAIFGYIKWRNTYVSNINQLKIPPNSTY
ncbi:Nicotinamide riboside transporter PnuC [Candidatus Hepatincolaceae symbiont of Richtersius coronifer]